MDNWLKCSAKAQARAIRERKISSREIVAAHLARIEKVSPYINAVVHLTAERAMKEAIEADAALERGEESSLGVLHGVPMTIKDNLDTQGVISTGGTQGRASFVPAQDATVVARLRAAGAILIGKTNTPELTMAYETSNLLHGSTSNPYDPALTTGGSSGGAAAIIAAGGSPFDIGSDTGGSIRVPAHFCGIAGLKPTAGLVPKTGHILPLGCVADAMTALGPMARHCEDLELLLGIISGPDDIDSRCVPVPLRLSSDVRLTRLRAAYYLPEPRSGEICGAVQSAVDILRESGVQMTEAVPPGLSMAFELTLALWTADGGRVFKDTLERAGTREFHPFMQTVLQVCKAGERSGGDFNALLVEWEDFRRKMLHFMQGYDLIVGPVLPFAALPHGMTFGDRYFSAFRHTMLHNLTGWPVVVIRAGTTEDGLPVGVQLAAAPWRDDIALAAAHRVEKGLSGWPALPPAKLMQAASPHTKL